MENLYIKVVNGSAVDHPSYESNLIQAFGSIPSDWQPFTRIKQNVTPTIFQNAVSTYVLNNGIWQDSWSCVDMDDAQKAEVISNIQTHGPESKKSRIDFVNSNLQNLTDANEISLWQSCLDSLNAWTMPEIDPNWTLETIPWNFPEFPKKS